MILCPDVEAAEWLHRRGVPSKQLIAPEVAEPLGWRTLGDVLGRDGKVTLRGYPWKPTPPTVEQLAEMFEGDVPESRAEGVEAVAVRIRERDDAPPWLSSDEVEKLIREVAQEAWLRFDPDVRRYEP